MLGLWFHISDKQLTCLGTPFRVYLQTDDDTCLLLRLFNGTSVLERTLKVQLNKFCVFLNALV